MSWLIYGAGILTGAAIFYCVVCAIARRKLAALLEDHAGEIIGNLIRESNREK